MVARNHLPMPPVNRLREIQLQGNHIAIVSADDHAELRKYNWYAKPSHTGVDYDSGWYAACMVTKGGRRTVLYMHRLITNAPPHLHVDHVDGNGLHNWRENLRLCEPYYNTATVRRLSSSGYRGVEKVGNRWRARIKGKHGRHIGYFDTAEQAARAYDRAALELWGDFAILNFPDEHPLPGRITHGVEAEEEVPF